MFTLRASHDGYAPHYKNNVLVDARNPERHDITLTRGDAIVGYVYDGTGQPLAGAAVALYASRGWMGMSGAKELEKTDGAGRFDFRIEPYNNRYMLRVVPPDGIDVVKMVNLPVREDVIVRIPGTGVIKGKVVDAGTQQPVAGAEVLIGVQAQQGRSWWPDFSKPVKTDDYGIFTVKGVGAGFLHSLSIRAKGFEQVQLSGMRPSDPVLWQRLTKVALDGSSETQLPEIALRRGRLMTGTVMDKETRRPIVGAEVEMRDWVMGSQMVRTDENGMYRFPGVGQMVSLRVSADGYAAFQDGGWRGWQVPEGDGPVTRDIQLESGAVLQGRVRAADGRPLVGALVRLEAAATGRQAWQARMALRPFYTYTDKDGNWEIGGVPPMKMRATAELQGFTTGRSKDQDVAAGDTKTKIDIELAGAASYEGVVIGRDNKPLAGAHITIAVDPGENANRWAQWRALGAGVSAYTGPKGRFVVGDIPTGNLLIRVEAPEHATLIAKRKSVKPGQNIAGQRHVLRPAFVITGKVVDPDGKAMAQAWIQARHTSSPDGEPSTQVIGARVESDGTFSISNLPEGTYTIEVRTWSGGGSGQRFKPLTREGVIAGTKDMVFQLEASEG